jgi:hypothetical protein
MDSRCWKEPDASHDTRTGWEAQTRKRDQLYTKEEYCRRRDSKRMDRRNARANTHD